MEANTAEAEDRIAGGVGLRNVDVATLERALKRVNTLLRVVRHHWEIGRRRRRSSDLERRPCVSSEEPGGEHWTAPAPIKVSATGVIHATEKLRGEVQPTRLRFRLNRKCRNCVWRGVIPRFHWLLVRIRRLSQQSSQRWLKQAKHKHQTHETNRTRRNLHSTSPKHTTTFTQTELHQPERFATVWFVNLRYKKKRKSPGTRNKPNGTPLNQLSEKALDFLGKNGRLKKTTTDSGDIQQNDLQEKQQRTEMKKLTQNNSE